MSILDEVTIIYHWGPDEQGRYEFTVKWWANYHPGHPGGEHAWRQRGQVFFDKPQKIIEAARRAGLKIIEEREN